MSIFNRMNPFKLPTSEQIRQVQLEEAERMALEHESAAEHHDALVTMYKGRADRLRAAAPDAHQAIDLKTGRRVA